MGLGEKKGTFVSKTSGIGRDDRTDISIVNYEVYQYQGALKEQQKSNKRASKVHEQEKKKNKNEKNFNNFERRRYDMDSLENKLMEANRNGTGNKA